MTEIPATAQQVLPTTAELPSIAGFNVLLMGPPGSGKTHALRTLLDCGITPFILATEPGIGEILGDIPPEKVHWAYIPPAEVGWDVMLTAAGNVNRMSFEALTKMTDTNKSKYDQFMKVIMLLANFKCDRTGEFFGPVDKWGTDRAIVVDSLSGLNIMAMDLVVGSKPVKAPGDWQVAMDNLQRLIGKLTNNTKAHFIMTAHLEREIDEMTGGIKLMASTLGRKLAPVLPRFFSDVIALYREGSNWYWSTAAANVDTKTRNLPIGDKLPPSFKQLVDRWKQKGGRIEATQQPTQPPVGGTTIANR